MGIVASEASTFVGRVYVRGVSCGPVRQTGEGVLPASTWTLWSFQKRDHHQGRFRPEPDKPLQELPRAYLAVPVSTLFSRMSLLDNLP
jgi:hypothetical protein